MLGNERKWKIIQDERKVNHIDEPIREFHTDHSGLKLQVNKIVGRFRRLIEMVQAKRSFVLHVSECTGLNEERVIELLEYKLKLSIPTGEMVVPLLERLKLQPIVSSTKLSYGIIRSTDNALFIRPDYTTNAKELLLNIIKEKDEYGKRKRNNKTVSE